MNPIYTVLTVITIILVASVSGCSKKEELSVDDGSEESKVELALNEQYDRVRNGARLVLKYDPDTNAFKGTVENTTDETLKQVRVEVHLSNGKELGPTTPGDLAPGTKKEILLPATGTDFNAWTAHPEVGEGEHSGEGEDSEHGGEGKSEHGHKEEGGEHDREGDHEHK